MAPTSTDVSARMKELAETFAAEHGLDFGLGSLAAFERIVKKQRGLPALAGVLEKHGACPYDPNIGRALPAIVRHATARPGKARPAKVQIAARYALSANREIADRLTPRERKELES